MRINTKKVLAFATAAVICAPFVVLAAEPSGFNPQQGQAGTNLATKSFSEILTDVLKWLLGILAVLAVLGFVISGIMYITAGGTERAETAKSWLIGSIVGLIVALLGYVIVITIASILGAG